MKPSTFRRAFPAMLVLAASALCACQPAIRAADESVVAISEAAVPAPIEPMLIPAPATLQIGKGEFVLDASTRVHAAGDAAQRVAKQFDAYLVAAKHTALEIDDEAASVGGIRFEVTPAGASSPEAYSLDVEPDGIVVRAATERGLFYGAVTLWQLLTQADGDRIALPALRIDDTPRFAWRGLMLDSARHFQSVDQIKQLLDAMALHKLNTFHWHLTDDQGWRIEIKQYPRLAEVGGCRVPAGAGGIDAASGKPRQYCGYYTQDQIRDVVRYAAERHITIVPEIDMPGHAQAAVAAYPALGVRGDSPAVSNEWGVNTYLFNVDESTFTFLENVLGEVVALFPGTYVHVGGDEAVKDQWQKSAHVQARMRELGLKDEMQLQSYFIKRMERFLVAHDRRLIGWDEILEGGLPPEATVMSWRGIEGGIEAATQGHDVVMSPVSDLYFDYLQTDSPNEPPGRPATIPLKQVYAFEPVPEKLAKDKQHHILGLQANVFTEHMRSFARVEHAVFPRIAALAETAWSPASRKDYAGFLARLPAQLRRYRALGIDYAQTPFAVRIEGTQPQGTDKLTVALSNPLQLGDIRYTTDGSVPKPTSPQYLSPLTLNIPVQVSATAFVDGQPLAMATTQRFDAASLLRRDDEALVMCSQGLMLRLEDDGPLEGRRAIYNVDIFNPCWLWRDAPLDDIAAIEVRAGRIPYYFQLAGDEANRKFRPARTARGELEVRAGCDGAVLASVPLPAAPDADGFIHIKAALPAHEGRQDLCLFFTGDTRPAMWAIDHVELLPRAATP